MNKLVRAFAALTFIVLMAACQTWQAAERPAEREAPEGSPFITVEGQQFIKNGKPYYFVGTNFWYGAYLGVTEEGRERLVKELDLLKATGITNLRVLAAAERTDLTMAVSPAAHEAPGQYNEELLVGLDVLLDEMAKRDMHAVIYFTNFWQWSGGMAQYMSWLTGEPALDPDVTGDWNAFMENSAAFYRMPEAQEWYQQLIETIVLRTNTVNGIPYKEDPTIMSWQLANEPRPGSDEYGRPYYSYFKQWIIDSAAFIKSLDDNHLVSTGNEGSMGTLRDLDLYIDSHSTPKIDYLTFHMWPKNWSWFDVTRPEETYASAVAKSKAYILHHLEVGRQLDKPMVLSEFGVERDDGEYGLGSTTVQRDRFLREIFRLLEQQARMGAPIAGSNFWTWGGYGRAGHDDFIWREGDDFTGDPPQEHQGLNSVFDVDTSTLKVIRDHADVMHGL